MPGGAAEWSKFNGAFQELLRTMYKSVPGRVVAVGTSVSDLAWDGLDRWRDGRSMRNGASLESLDCSYGHLSVISTNKTH